MIDRAATPDLVPKGAMVLQPSEERRRSGSHYTPRALTEPIVRTTLEPILARLRGDDGRPPRPEQILDLKVCDPAMGSGAFLVEACRQLGDALVEAWHAHGEVPAIPPDEDEVIFARRLVAQRCLYGVDRNPVAVDLAKVSLWLVTLAKDHALTFVDHALRHGDSLVGLSRKQIEAFHWDTSAPGESPFRGMRVREHVAEGRRAAAADPRGGRGRLRLGAARPLGRGAVRAGQGAALRGSRAGGVLRGRQAEGAGGEAERVRERGRERRGRAATAAGSRSGGTASQPLVPFHWEIEFPEVFERENPGFDAVVGNPPFLGGTQALSELLGAISRLAETQQRQAAAAMPTWSRTSSGGPSTLLRDGGTFGSSPRTRSPRATREQAGLRWICRHGGEIFAARKRVQVAWSGGGGRERRSRRQGATYRTPRARWTRGRARSLRSCSTLAGTTIQPDWLAQSRA